MSAESARCCKCKGEMVQGFVFEFQGPKLMVSTWVEGAPQKSIFASAKVAKEKCLPVGTFRRSAYGFLESYARSDFGAQ